MGRTGMASRSSEGPTPSSAMVSTKAVSMLRMLAWGSRLAERLAQVGQGGAGAQRRGRQSGGHELHGSSLLRRVGVGAADGATEVRAIARPTLKVMALQSSCRNGELYIRGKSIVLLMPTHIRVYTHSQTHMYRHTYIYTNTPTNTHTYRYTQTLQSLLTKHTSLIYT